MIEHHEAFPGVMNGGIIGTLLDCHCNWTAAHHLMLARGAAASADRFIDPRPIWGPNNSVLHRTPGFEAFIKGLGLSI